LEFSTIRLKPSKKPLKTRVDMVYPFSVNSVNTVAAVDLRDVRSRCEKPFFTLHAWSFAGAIPFITALLHAICAGVKGGTERRKTFKTLNPFNLKEDEMIAHIITPATPPFPTALLTLAPESGEENKQTFFSLSCCDYAYMIVGIEPILSMETDGDDPEESE
jgi:hypothetical protein